MSIARALCGHTVGVTAVFDICPRSGCISVVGTIAMAMVLGALPANAQTREQVYAARVSHVFDGDTLWVRPSDGGGRRKLRIEGIDAPEICQHGGVAARDALRQRLDGQTVTVREHSRDTYGRPLVALALGPEDVAAWMVTQGWAWSYRWQGDPGPFARQEELARARHRGIFATGAAAEEPRAFRRRHGPCQRR
jgi:micrococcal nuclease